MPYSFNLISQMDFLEFIVQLKYLNEMFTSKSSKI